MSGFSVDSKQQLYQPTFGRLAVTAPGKTGNISIAVINPSLRSQTKRASQPCEPKISPFAKAAFVAAGAAAFLARNQMTHVVWPIAGQYSGGEDPIFSADWIENTKEDFFEFAERKPWLIGLVLAVSVVAVGLIKKYYCCSKKSEIPNPLDSAAIFAEEREVHSICQTCIAEEPLITHEVQDDGAAVDGDTNRVPTVGDGKEPSRFLAAKAAHKGEVPPRSTHSGMNTQASDENVDQETASDDENFAPVLSQLASSFDQLTIAN